ncbi:hypothetical protein VJ918_11495, partial [Adlercreutzia sp. R21]|uniref:hypothetical protein n=1 Tax=Adlercreutzia wanghongyangiae TaxID=3111451 RepID=UPI002DB58DC1
PFLFIGSPQVGHGLLFNLPPPRNRELFLNLSGSEQVKDQIWDTLSVRVENSIDLTFQKKIGSRPASTPDFGHTFCPISLILSWGFAQGSQRGSERCLEFA